MDPNKIIILAVIATSVATFISRFLGALTSERVDASSKLFFDLSENTGLPYTITIRSKNLEVTFDEINNNVILKQRPKKMEKKPF